MDKEIIYLCLTYKQRDMKLIRLIFTSALIVFSFTNLTAQNNYSTNATSYGINAFGSAATGDNTPFWITSNQYGIVPLEAGNGYLDVEVFHFQNLNKGFKWGAGLDLIASAPRYKNAYIQQLFIEFGYKNLFLTIGSKEQYRSLWDKNLSSGDMMQSANARPIPEINIHIPDFIVVPYTRGWLQLKGNVAVGRSFDSNYLGDFIQKEQTYIKNVLWHHKSGFIRIQDTKNDFPIFLTLGLQHTVQWGGTSTNPAIGKQPQSFKDFIRVFFGKQGDEGASISDQINALGSHHISYDFQLGFKKADWSLQAYYQHLSADRSGLLLYNGTDGLWGGQLELKKVSWLKKVVIEYFTTKNQSGPFHFIDFDHEKYPGRGGGGDNYYNNGEYVTGYSYFNRGVGSPLVPAPEYNTNGKLGFSSTRVQDWHIGLEGDLSSQVSYRVLATIMNGWGTPYQPFLKKKTGTSCLIDIFYSHPKLTGWSFKGTAAADTGDVLGKKSLGFSFSVRKEGLLKTW